METDLEFSGERFIPGIEDKKLEVEHYQRYKGVCSLVEGKSVLDAACGEGYGSSMLARFADHVVAIDIDTATINHARMKYADQKNIDFISASIASLPIEDNSIDVVVSFETIEHVTEEIQYRYLEEINRVLKKDGILVMSTPNKSVYSDRHNYKNEFHKKEFYYDEFVDFLQGKFTNVRMYSQRFEVTSVISSCDGKADDVIAFETRSQNGSNSKYLIAIASNRDISNIEGFSSVYVEDENEYERIIDRIIELQNEETIRNEHIAKLDKEILEARSRIQKLQAEEEERNNHIHKLDQEIEVKNQTISILEREKGNYDLLTASYHDELERRNNEVSILEQNYKVLTESYRVELERKTNEVSMLKENYDTLTESYRSELEKKNNEVLALNKTISDSEEKENKWLVAQKQIDTLNAEKENLVNNANVLKETCLANEKIIEELRAKEADLQQIIRNKEGHIELLLESERAYERDKQTYSYRFMLGVRKVIDWLFPAKSKRRFFAGIIFNIFKHPKLMLKVINPQRIKSYFYFLKREGMESVIWRYQETLEIEQYKLSPTNDIQVELIQDDAENADEYEPLVLPNTDSPLVSIVIPVYNQFDYTYKCIKSIINNSGNVRYEVIIADDCSTDLTKNIDEIIKNVNIVTTEHNVRFLLNCNNAAKHARGKYILFLNNDTQVQNNWLEPLVNLIERNDQIGMVGSQLLYPDGLVQEAGGIVWKDGSAWNYGNGKNPEDPEYNYVKEADYISGAAIMIRKALWDEIGGFDERFAPAYYEDTDLAFEVRKKGYKVMYQPLSRVVHFEGVSNGTNINEGVKRYQEVNFHKFYDKWKETLEKEHEENGVNVFTAKDRSNHKKHILVVDHYVPHHDQDAGGKCTFMYLQTFVKMGLQVTFIGDNFFKHEPYTTELNQMGIEVLYGNYYYNNWQDWLKENAHYFDFIYLQRPHISIKYIDLVKQYSSAKIFYFAHDLHHVREYREYEITHDPEKLASSEKWKKIEYELFEKADVGHVVGSYEQQVMQKVFPDKPIRNIPLYIYEKNLNDINKNFAERNDIMYVGGFGHPPNIDAVVWFAKEVYPKVLDKFPNLKWHVVGNKAPQQVLDLASDNIIIEGFLSDADLEKLYRESRMAVVPLRYGAGVKGKVVEAAYYQIPLITTPIGAEGLSLEEHFMEVEEDPEKFAEKICNLYENYDELKKMSDAGADFISNHFTLDEAERVLKLDMDI